MKLPPCCVIRRIKNRRPRHHSHAHDPGVADHHAGLRPPRHHPSVVFGGFSGEACGLRAADSGSRVLIYSDGYFRNGKWVDHKGNADIAVQTAQKEGQHIDKVLVWRRYSGKYNSESPMIMKRDHLWMKF